MSAHLKIAKSEGAQAGLAALTEYLDSPLGSTNPHMEDVIEALDEAGTKAKRLAWYCDFYGVTKKAPKKSKGKAEPRANRKGNRKTRTPGTITAGEAWVLLGSNPDFEPNDPSKPAGGRVLYRLNVQGHIEAR